MKNDVSLSKARWTHKPPSRAGSYEWRGPYTVGSFVGVVSFRGEPTITFTDGDCYPLSELDGEWRRIEQ
jgi:hypothetical protein